MQGLIAIKHHLEGASKTLGALFSGGSPARKPCQCGAHLPLSTWPITSPGAHDLEQALTL